MNEALTTWNELPDVWQIVFREAWTSWGEGNYGIGAALVDPATTAIVSTGRNRIMVADEPTERRDISGNFVAHAEMNALISLERFKADGLHLYTTLEPCLMCAATAMMMHVDTVHFAASDEMFSDIEELWEQHPYGRKRKPHRYGPLQPALAGFARLLPLVQQSTTMTSGNWVMTLAREKQPAIARLAEELAATNELGPLLEAVAPVEQALDRLWSRLPH